ncbi:MAG: hypothetical protein K0B15_09475 [Lentimicrobium sp.]|nr:hypothetical protein [Lentimicrobium sp.]
MISKDNISAFIKNRKLFLIPAFLLFIPLFFTGIRTDHDWGDDFAQYLSQAENIFQGMPMAQTGYIYNPEYPSLGPKAYPPGFPLLIAPIVGKYGYNIIPVNYLISALLILTAIFSVLLFYRQTGWISAIFLSAVIYYNPYIISLKGEVMADIPFSLLFLVFILIIYGSRSISKYLWITAGVIAGLAITVKSIGVVLPVSLIVFSIQQFFLSRYHKETIREAFAKVQHQIMAALIALGISLLFNLLFMRGTSGGGYLNIYNYSMISEAFATNVYVYSEAVRMFFINPDSPLFWIGFPVGAAILAFFIAGLFLSFFRKPQILDWITVIYISILLVYPYHNSGFRFLLPISPVILLYSVKTISLLTSLVMVKRLLIVFSMLILLTYIRTIPGYFISEEQTLDGPYAPHVETAFAEVKALTDVNARIVFIKPRALARFAGRKSMSHHPLSKASEIYHEFQYLNPTHFLVYSELPDPALVHYLQTNQNEVRLIWRDEFFRLYQKSD